MTAFMRTLKTVHITSLSVQSRSIYMLPRRNATDFICSFFYRSDESCSRLNCRRNNCRSPAKTQLLPRQLHRLLCSTATCNSGSSTDKRSESKVPKIYTRTGDKGTSVTIAGDRRPKNDQVFEALGATDELSSQIGLAREFVLESNLEATNLQLEEIQCILQDAGSNIATPKSLASKNQLAMTEFNSDTVEMLETWIDEMTTSLPPLRNFILPSGGKASSTLHVARSVCRRAERSISPLCTSDEIDPAVGRFINRLSDYLFTAARYVAQEEGKKETIYRRVKPKDKK
ncbi:corrinoid adenosyltransferase-like [Lytechinus variegatus]|uniref:corrinoid adenosyltransferase-like n=1 Tax=Lytechinus variegatus TaxID=7654 RepID=UPI001BB0DC30|nr:corrinoid adenosyltransferase-like [Lytechinus variegatus]